MSKVKVLFFAADPLSAPPDGRSPRLLLDEDVRQIRQKVRAAKHRGVLDFDLHLAARADDLIQALIETRPQVVHFSGHGDRDGLVLASADGMRAHPVDAAALKQLFEVFRGDIRVVVLSACLSLPQARAIADVVGCAIGTRGSISDEAAITFGAAFYRALASGESVQAAYDQARAALALEHFEERDCPELVARPDVDPARLVLVPAGGTDPGPRALQGAGAPQQDSGTREELSRQPPAAPPVARPRTAARWAGMAAVAVGLASGIVFFDDPPRPGPLGVMDRPPAAPRDPAAVAKELYEAGHFDRALPLFQRAAAAGNAEAMGFLGSMYLDGQGTAPDPYLADYWLQKAVHKRDPRGMNARGTAYERGVGRTQSYRWAMYWYEEAAEKGYAPAMSNVARMYMQGLGVEASPGEALAWYLRAARRGLVDALVDAGKLHEQGLAGTPDREEALRLYREAARKGSARGMVEIGRMYQEGDGVPQDYAQARSWYLQGAQAGSAEAMNRLGVLYRNGWGVARDREEAIRWFRRAARAGSTVAAANPAALGEG